MSEEAASGKSKAEKLRIEVEKSRGKMSKIGDVPSGDLQKKYDLVVIGGGPVGVAGAVKGATLGRRVLLIDKPKMAPNAEGLDVSFGGPTGLFSKALREAGKTVDVVSLKSMGLYEPVIWSQVQHTCGKLATSNADHQVKLLAYMKVGYLQASATIESPTKIIARRDDGQEWTVTTDKILLATGSKPTRPANIPFDDVRVFDSDTVNALAFLPKSVAISGGGIISIEYAKIFRKLGAQVSLLVRSGAKSSLERIGLDSDIADHMLGFLRDDNVQILEGTEVETYEVNSEKVKLKLKSKAEGAPAELTCDIFLAAIGRRPNVSGIGLDALGVKLADKGGHVEVDARFCTSVPGIFAAGDVIGPPSLASTGVHQAQGAVSSMFNAGKATQGTNFPVGMWTTPECAYYGLTKAAALKQGMDVEEGIAPYVSCLRGRVFHPEGLLKLVFQKLDGVIVGVHMIGADACELVHYGMDLVEQKVSIFTIVSTLYTAVTYHELFKEAALNGNSKCAYGAQWQTILSDLGADNVSDKDYSEETMRKEFEAMDTSGDGSLDAEELFAVFQKMGKDIEMGTVANLVRLADEDGTDKIEWEEFAKIFRVVREMQDSAKSQVNVAAKTPAPETKQAGYSPSPRGKASPANADQQVPGGLVGA